MWKNTVNTSMKKMWFDQVITAGLSRGVMKQEIGGSKSEPRTTTYGSCSHCVRSGPVGRFCSQCNIPEAGYVIMINGPPESTKILDSISLAQLFDLGQHESASARKVSTPIMQKLHHFDTSCARVAAGRMYQHIQDPVEKENMIRLKMVEFRNFLED